MRCSKRTGNEIKRNGSFGDSMISGNAFNPIESILWWYGLASKFTLVQWNEMYNIDQPTERPTDHPSVRPFDRTNERNKARVITLRCVISSVYAHTHTLSHFPPTPLMHIHSYCTHNLSIVSIRTHTQQIVVQRSTIISLAWNVHCTRRRSEDSRTAHLCVMLIWISRATNPNIDDVAAKGRHVNY